jgi:hypothetical protein
MDTAAFVAHQRNCVNADTNRIRGVQFRSINDCSSQTIASKQARLLFLLTTRLYNYLDGNVDYLRSRNKKVGPSQEMLVSPTIYLRILYATIRPLVASYSTDAASMTMHRTASHGAADSWPHFFFLFSYSLRKASQRRAKKIRLGLGGRGWSLGRSTAATANCRRKGIKGGRCERSVFFRIASKATEATKRTSRCG